MFPHVTFSTTEVGCDPSQLPGVPPHCLQSEHNTWGGTPTMAASGTPTHPKRGAVLENLGKVRFEPRRKLSSPGFLVFGLLASMEWHLHRGNLWRARQWGGWKIPKIPKILNPPPKEKPGLSEEIHAIVDALTDRSWKLKI